MQNKGIYMQIHEVCKQTGLTKRTIRFYIEKGLIAPSIVNKNGKDFREYSKEDVEELVEIRDLRKLLFSIEEIVAIKQGILNIKELINVHSNELEKMVQNQMEVIEVLKQLEEQQIQDMRSLSAHLKKMMNKLEIPKEDLRIDNKDRFIGKAEIYSKYRPSYPERIIDEIEDELRESTYRRVADIGAGTGLFTKILLDRGYEVVAVEPNKEMREIAEIYLEDYEKIEILDSMAEDTKIAENSIDLVTVAQAFHWFDKSKFREECKRILKQDGKIALIWNSRDYNSILVRELSAVCTKFCPKFKGFSGGIDNEPEVFDNFFEEYRQVEINNPLQYNLEEFIGRNLSGSYAPKSGEKNYKPFVEAIKQVFDKYSKYGKVILPNVVRVYMGKINQ